MVWLLTDSGERQMPDAAAESGSLWLSPEDMTAATGWELKPEGLCLGEVCVPVPPGQADGMVRDGKINAAGFWRHMGWPVASSDDGEAWLLGEGAETRRSSLEALTAPDFTLPDLDGVQHSLSAERGKKVFLATWASW